jgi:hypothetical protein
MFVHERGAASMGGAVAITRVDLTAAELRAAAGREKNGSAARRMLALAMVLDGADRKSAAETCGISEHHSITTIGPDLVLASLTHSRRNRVSFAHPSHRSEVVVQRRFSVDQTLFSYMPTTIRPLHD